MKNLLLTTFLAQISFITANKSQMIQDVIKMNKLHEQSKPQKPGERALLQADMGLLNQYGCWCYFETDHGSGKGQPVDEIDSFCKVLHDGYTCIQMDAQEKGIDCVPWEVSYNSAFGSGIPYGLSMEGLVEECNRQNGIGTCQAWTCKVEGWFVQSYFTYSAFGGQINLANRHENGFDTNLNCPINNGPSSDKACCGFYPLRFPYKTYNGERGCCYGHTFNAEMNVCCEDGKSRMVC